MSLWDRAESAEAYNRTTSRGTPKLLVKFVEGTPQVVTNFTFHKIAAAIAVSCVPYGIAGGGIERKRRRPPVRRQDDLHESGRDSMRCDSKRAQSLGERKTARNLEPSFLVCTGRQEFRFWSPKVKMWYVGRSN